MPVRSTSSSVFRWPELETVRAAARAWAREQAGARADVLRIGMWGSAARGDWGVGSDLDLVVVLECCDLPWERRGVEWDTTSLPVPADVLVYTQEEWAALDPGSRFARVLAQEARWLFVRGAE